MEGISFRAIIWGMIDFAMDMCALCAVQICLGALCLRRLLLAEAVLFAATLLNKLSGASGAPFQLAVFLGCAAALTDAPKPRRVIETALCLLCAFATGAGLAGLGGGSLPLAPLGVLGLAWLLRARKNLRCRWNVELCVELGGERDHFSALIDTGNRLRDPRSGLPVLIVEAAAAPHIAAAVERRGCEDARTLPFGVLGGAGELRCYRPDRVELRAAGQPPRGAPPCLIATFPGRIPGSTRALAPPEFAFADGVHRLRKSTKF